MVTDLVNAPVKIIDFSEKKEAWIIRKLDDLKMENVAVINLHRLNNYRDFNDIFPQFRKLMENREYFKILHSETEDDVKNLPASIGWQNRDDVVYAGEELQFDENIIRSYLRWKCKSRIISTTPFFQRVMKY